jgi:hypothetical protein
MNESIIASRKKPSGQVLTDDFRPARSLGADEVNR